VIIVCAVRWYLRYSLSYRDVKELVTERGLSVDHTTIWRWVQRYAPKLNQRCRRELKPTNGSWRVDETYIRVAGQWSYLYRAVDSSGASIDFWFSALCGCRETFFPARLKHSWSSSATRNQCGRQASVKVYEGRLEQFNW